MKNVQKDCSKIHPNLAKIIEKNLDEIENQLAKKYSFWNNSCGFISR